MRLVERRGLQVILVLSFLTVIIYFGCYGKVNGVNLLEDIEQVNNETVVDNFEKEEEVTEIVDLEVASISPIRIEMEVLAASEEKEDLGYIVETEYDEKIIVENGLEFHYIAGDTFRGLMTVIKDPSRVFVGMPHATYDGTPGDSATNIAHRYDALYAVNGAFFVDTNYAGNGGTPIGFVFSEGKQTYGGSGTAYVLMGLDNDNNFILDTMTGAQAQERGIRDAVTCKPVLVKDGAITDLKGASLTLTDARTCIGARADGAILFLTIDGRMSHSFGATTADCANVMLAYGAVNAGNLDGGGSVSIYYSGETPIDTSLASLRGSRRSPEAFCVRRE